MEWNKTWKQNNIIRTNKGMDAMLGNKMKKKKRGTEQIKSNFQENIWMDEFECNRFILYFHIPCS